MTLALFSSSKPFVKTVSSKIVEGETRVLKCVQFDVDPSITRVAFSETVSVEVDVEVVKGTSTGVKSSSPSAGSSDVVKVTRAA